MSISMFGFTLIRSQELDAIRARVRDLQEDPQPSAGEASAAQTAVEEPEAGESQVTGTEPPRVVRELIRLADGLPDLTGDHAAAAPVRADELARWLETRTQALLKACDVELVEDNGPLDLQRHEVIATRAAPASDLVHHIADTARPGYSWHGRLIRPQQVVVYTTDSSDKERIQNEAHHEGI
jgi:hypothetical protein